MNKNGWKVYNDPQTNYKIALITKSKDELIKYLLGCVEDMQLETFNDSYFLYELDEEKEDIDNE